MKCAVFGILHFFIREEVGGCTVDIGLEDSVIELDSCKKSRRVGFPNECSLGSGEVGVLQKRSNERNSKVKIV